MQESIWDVKCPKCDGENSEDCSECEGIGMDDPTKAIQRISNYLKCDPWSIGPTDVEILIKAGKELERRANNNLTLARHLSSGELAF